MQVIDTLNAVGKAGVAINMANGLQRLGYDSHLIATRRMGPLLPMVSEEVHTWFANRRSRLDLAGIRRIAFRVDSLDIDVLHTHGRFAAYLTRIVLRFCKHKPIHVVHDHDGPALGNRKLTLYDWLMLRSADGYIAVSRALRQRAAKLLKLSEERCVYVCNGIDVPPPRDPWQGRPTVIQVANIHWPKGHSTAVRAAAIVRQRFPDLQWICVGRVGDPSSSYVRDVQELVDSLDLSGCVKLIGESLQVNSLLREAHVGVLTSDAEGLPLSLLEYMAGQLPVVTTEVGEGPTIVREAQAGIVVPPGDPQAVAEGISTLLADPADAQLMGRRGHAHVVSHFSIDNMARQVDSLYRRLLPTERAPAVCSHG